MALAIVPAANLAASTGSESLITLWSLSTPAPTPAPAPAPAPASMAEITVGFRVRALAFGSDPARLVRVGDGGRVGIWRARSWTLEKSLEAGPASIYWVAFLPRADEFITGSADGVSLRWSLNSGGPKRRLGSRLGARLGSRLEARL